MNISGGIQKNLGLPELTDYEKCLLENAIVQIKEHISKAEKYLKIKNPMDCDPCDSDPNAIPCPRDSCKPPSLYD